ncbi:hypothetical protein D3C81_1677320 [compost metagenome]
MSIATTSVWGSSTSTLSTESKGMLNLPTGILLACPPMPLGSEMFSRSTNSVFLSAPSASFSFKSTRYRRLITALAPQKPSRSISTNLLPPTLVMSPITTPLSLAAPSLRYTRFLPV